jgi:hypothetical protein
MLRSAGGTKDFFYLLVKDLSLGLIFRYRLIASAATKPQIVKSFAYLKEKTAMRRFLPILLLFLLILPGCGPSQQITVTWINPERSENAPFEKIFVLVMSPNAETNFRVEDRLAGIIASRGQEYVLSSMVFPPNTRISENFTKEQMAEAIRRTGCDAVFIIAEVDVKEVTHYKPGVSYSPYAYNHFGSYYGYYNYYYPMIYSPGYYTTDRTFYIETIFFDLEKDDPLWLIMSEAYNPASLDSWFDVYIRQLFEELRREGLVSE